MNEALRWDGAKWITVVTPNPGGAPSGSNHALFGIACTSASNCWAVGDGSQSNSGPELNEALHWNGTRWLAVSTPQPSGTSAGDTNQLPGVSCTSASNCWAVGDTQGLSPAPELNQILHWNGTHWSQVSTPEPGGTSNGDTNELGPFGGAVTCASASNCWAVGHTQAGTGTPQLNEALHWNGAHWSQISTPEPGGTATTSSNQLNAVTCTSASNCSAVGNYLAGSGASLNEVLHWNGQSWIPAAAIDLGGDNAGAKNEARDVACPAVTNCLAVGIESASAGPLLNDTLQWTGGVWLGVPTPEPSGVNPGDVNQLVGVACPSPSNCWAVGLIGTEAEFNQILHWNGHTWVTA